MGNMASKADYLKKYLEPDKREKKRKVKSKGNLTVKDTDVDWDDIKPDDDAEFAPTIACVVDDRPDALRRKQDGWKAIGDKNKTKKPKKDDESQKRRKRVDSDDSPPRRKRADSDGSPVRKRHDSDKSPKRRKRADSSDASPPRQKRVDSDDSP